MPPKKKPAAATALRPDLSAPGSWMFRNDKKALKDCWTLYSPVENTAIEAAYGASSASAKLVSGYTVDLVKMVQVNDSDKSKIRTVKRVAAPATPATKKAKAALPDVIELMDSTVSDVEVVRTKPAPSCLKPGKTAATTPTVADGAKPTKMARVESAPLTRFGETKTFAVIDLPASAPVPANPGRMAPPKVRALIENILQCAPRINRMPLQQAADAMCPNTRHWLQRIGRPPAETGLELTLAAPLAALPREATVQLTPTATVSVDVLQRLSAGAIVSHTADLPDALVLPAGKNFTAAVHNEALSMMISGPAMLLYDGDYRPVAAPPVATVCSIPGINFAYSPIDAARYTTRDGDEPRVIDQPATLKKMGELWHHILRVMDEKFKVQFPVLCAIGCGAFRGKFGSQVPRLWARALYGVLSTGTWKHIEAVLLSLPTFGDTNNFMPFVTTLRNLSKEAGPLLVPVVAIEDASMVALAAMLSDAGYRTGLLNPSDVEALRRGYVGMYWDGGHIALEEVLALQTTLLLHHANVTPALFHDKARRWRVPS
jgi:hypothetical protein